MSAGESAIDLRRWAVVGPKNGTGLGRMTVDLRRMFGLGRHIVIPNDRLENDPLEEPWDVLLRADAPASEAETSLEGLQGVVFLERTGNVELLRVAHRKGIHTVCVPMWEWFNGKEPDWQLCGLFICPNRYGLSVVQRFGFKNVIHLPWPLEIARFPERKVTGPARVFVHNAGLVDQDDRKGTRDAIVAFQRVKNPDIRLIVRMQKEAEMPRGDSRIEIIVGNLANPGALYAEGDVAIQPSKLEGLGFMVLEPVAAGLPVVTLNYPPMNEIVRNPALLVRPRWFKRRSYGAVWFKQAHLRLPCRRDLARKIAWCAENDLTEISAYNRRWATETFDPETLRQQWIAVLHERFLASSQRSAK